MVKSGTPKDAGGANRDGLGIPVILRHQLHALSAAVYARKRNAACRKHFLRRRPTTRESWKGRFTPNSADMVGIEKTPAPFCQHSVV
jgi:hypothetical protein